MRISEIKTKFEQMGVDLSAIVFGRGCSRKGDIKKQGKQYKLQSNIVNSDTKAVIQYCKDIDQYIAWLTENKVKRSVFTVASGDVPLVVDSSVMSIKKGVQYRDWKTKEVYTFNTTGIETFAKKFLL